MRLKVQVPAAAKALGLFTMTEAYPIEVGGGSVWEVRAIQQRGSTPSIQRGQRSTIALAPLGQG